MKTGVMKILPGVTICMILFTSDRSAIKPCDSVLPHFRED